MIWCVFVLVVGVGVVVGVVGVGVGDDWSFSVWFGQIMECQDKLFYVSMFVVCRLKWLVIDEIVFFGVMMQFDGVV